MFAYFLVTQVHVSMPLLTKWNEFIHLVNLFFGGGYFPDGLVTELAHNVSMSMITKAMQAASSL